MGLDITWYKNLTKVGDTLDTDEKMEEAQEDSIVLYQNPHFPNHFQGLAEKQAYESEESDSFRAGSYSGYNSWRNQLSQLAGYVQSESGRYDETAWNNSEGPFNELIHFSDCEGSIGSETSKKLAEDFEKFQEEANKQDEYFLSVYNNFKEAFQMASQNGAVCFH